MVLAILVGIISTKTSFDNRDSAAGKVYFVESNGDLQDVLNKAADSDAIFLKVGTYTTKDVNGFSIKNKNIRILGAGTDFVNVLGNNNSYVFNIENASVRFESLKIGGANKDGVLIKNSGQKEVSFKDVVISNNSGNGIKSDSKLTLTGVTLNQNGSGIEAVGDLNVESTLIQNSADYGVSVPAISTATVKIQNGILTNNKGKAISLLGAKSISLKNLTVFNNGSGIVESGSGTLNITNSIVQDSTNEGISVKTPNARVAYTNSFGNKGGDFLPITLKDTEGNLSVDSMFASDSDLHIKLNSALVNKGIATENDNDGSRIDLGAFGGNPVFASINAEPRIESIPGKYVKPGEFYSYEVKATDPDKDTLSYVVLNTNAPKWLKQENNKFSGTPSTSDIGFSGVLLLVTDKKGHNIIHPISINVIPADRSVPNDDNNPTPSPIAGPVVPRLKIISPTKGSVMSNESREIKWEISNKIDIDKFVIKYSDDKENFKTLATLKGTESTYNWDINSLVPGKYVIKIEATDKSSTPVTISEISDEFEVKVTPTTKPNVQSITITKNSPADNDSVASRKQIIFVEFKPDADIDTSKTFIKVNNQNVEYKSTRSTVYYEPKTDLTGARTQVEVKIVTKEGAEASRRWTFSLPVTPQSQDTTPQITETKKILGLPRVVGLIVLGIIILGLLLLILYFIFKLIKTIRQERQGNLEAEFTEYYGTDTTYDPIQPQTTQTTTTSTIYSPDQGPQIEEIDTQYNLTSPTTTEYHIDETTVVDQSNLQNQDIVKSNTVETRSSIPAEDHLSKEVKETTVEYNANLMPQDNTLVSHTTTTTSTTPVSDTGNTPVTQTVQNQEEDEYIKSLKEKYGITEDSNISITTTTETTTLAQNNADLNDQNLPDPTQASQPPKKS
jgi:hypothetical protein